MARFNQRERPMSTATETYPVVPLGASGELPTQGRISLALEIMYTKTCATEEQRRRFVKWLRDNSFARETVNREIVLKAREIARPGQRAELDALLIEHGFVVPAPPQPTTTTVRMTIDVEVDDPKQVIQSGDRLRSNFNRMITGLVPCDDHVIRNVGAVEHKVLGR